MLDWNPKEDTGLQEAIKNYLSKHNLYFDSQIEYKAIIDGVYICVSGHPVLRVGLPPVSNYSIRETEYTDKYIHVKVA